MRGARDAFTKGWLSIHRMDLTLSGQWPFMAGCGSWKKRVAFVRPMRWRVPTAGVSRVALECSLCRLKLESSTIKSMIP
jgi:hypothetical protein